MNFEKMIAAAEGGEDVRIRRGGRDVAVVMGVERYESLLETLDVLSDADAMAALEDDDPERDWMDGERGYLAAADAAERL